MNSNHVVILTALSLEYDEVRARLSRCSRPGLIRPAPGSKSAAWAIRAAGWH